MQLSIMQPTFMPWVGYFSMIVKNDLFVFLDDVQFERRSFQSRNKILINNDSKMITVPVHNKNKYNQLISEVEINYTVEWIDKFLKTIYFNYCKHNFFNEVFFILEKSILKREKKLIDLNLNLIFSICEYLNIKTKFDLSSKYKINEKKSKKILELILKIGGTRYLTPDRSKDYLEKDMLSFSQKNIEVIFLQYTCKKYLQKNSQKFISHLSIVDLLFNHGKDSIKFL